MQATYDARTDTLSIILIADAAVAESDEDKPGVILDYDEQGNLVSLEILDASKRVTDARKIESRRPSDPAGDEDDISPRTPRTALGERLLRIRERIVASGEPLLSWADIDREVAERRGQAEQR